MQLNVVHYIVLAFIVVIAIIYMAKSMASAMVMAGCLAYILIISNNMVNLENNLHLGVSKESSAATDPAAADILDDKPQAVKDQPPADFSDDYKEYDEFRQSYTNVHNAAPPRVAYDNAEKTYSIDLANTMNATRRFRDQRAMNGTVIRNANFYKYHYGDELEQAENRPWWGRGEY